MLKGLTASASPFFCGCTLWLHSPYAFSLMASKMFLSNHILPATHILRFSGSGKFVAFLSFPHCFLEKLTSEETQANKQKSHKHKGFAACWKCIGVEKQLCSCQLNLIQTSWSKMITRLCFVQKIFVYTSGVQQGENISNIEVAGLKCKMWWPEERSSSLQKKFNFCTASGDKGNVMECVRFISGQIFFNWYLAPNI